MSVSFKSRTKLSQYFSIRQRSCYRRATMLPVFAVLFLLNACGSQPDIVELKLIPKPLTITLDRGVGEPPQRLNVSIIAFDSSLLEGGSTQFYKGLRIAEAGYMPVVLKGVLQSSNYWGAIRVLPGLDPGAEVTVNARLLSSDAVKLSLEVDVYDSRGVHWFQKVYTDTAIDHGYLPDKLGGKDPFQDLYKNIANDMNEYRQTLTSLQHNKLLDMSTLRYAASLAPEAFSRFLETEKDANGDFSLNLVGLPARDDKMFERVQKIRETEYRFIDVMDQQFAEFYKKMQTAYPYWREYSYELMVYNDKLEGAGTIGFRPKKGSWQALEDVYETYREYKLNEDELRELSQSLKSEIKPTVAEYEGRVFELEGSLETQYKKWREILKEIYSLER